MALNIFNCRAETLACGFITDQFRGLGKTAAIKAASTGERVSEEFL